MASKTNGGIKRPEMPNHVREEGPNWVIILGGALLSTLSIKLCCKLKQVFHQKRPTRTRVLPRGPNHATVNSMFKVGNSLPLIKVPSIHSSTDNGEFLWAPVTDRLELPLKPFNNPNSSDSPCISESGSDIHSKREVLKKLRLQLRSRDDMIMEMQAQITDLQKSMNIQVALTTHLQNQLSSSTEFLSDSSGDPPTQKSIADHFVCETGLPENTWR
ncbi:hypothetical protein HPP92_022761 [Vanilla planifolia]|uniref:Uncharacterized protein n=1 Tax=Vanilla planifolia TaxID=51239 RepID=A0A835PTY9_VANPL|nr:hypothetical protein HPP92_022761 [Vanilla planifolia]